MSYCILVWCFLVTPGQPKCHLPLQVMSFPEPFRDTCQFQRELLKRALIRIGDTRFIYFDHGPTQPEPRK